MLGENVAQAAQFVESGAADAGLIAHSLALAPELRDKGRFVVVPIDSYPTLEQGAVVLDSAADPDAAQAFLDFVAGPDGRAVLDRYGFLPAEPLMDWQAVGLSVRLGLATTAVLIVIGMPIGYWLARSRRPWRPLVEALVALPLVLPPTVLGFYLLLAMGPRGPARCAVGDGDRRTTRVLVRGPCSLASVISSLPFAVQPFSVAFAAVDRSLLETSWTLGRSGVATFFRVVIPLSVGGILTGMVLTFAHTIGEFGVVLMVGGSIPGETRTVALVIYDRVQALDYGGAAATALPLLVLSFVVLAVTYGLRGLTVAPWLTRR